MRLKKWTKAALLAAATCMLAVFTLTTFTACSDGSDSSDGSGDTGGENPAQKNPILGQYEDGEHELEGGFKISVNKTDESVRLTGYTGEGGDITIPNGVTTIGVQAFNGCTSLTNVTISKYVTKIGGRAFDGCTSLVSVTFAVTTDWYVDENTSADVSDPNTNADNLKDRFNKWGYAGLQRYTN